MTNVLTWSYLCWPLSDLRSGVDKARACCAIRMTQLGYPQTLLTPISRALLRDEFFQGEAELGGSVWLLWCGVVHQNKMGMVVIQGIGWALDIVI